MPVFHSEQWVGVELARVFSFFSDPNNLPRLMPAARGARIVRLKIVTPPAFPPSGQVVAGPGSEIEISFRLVPLLPFRATWLARILEFEPYSYFTDAQVRGPFRRWDHRHEFIAEERGGRPGTIIRDHVEYEVGYGILGWLGGPFVRAAIARMFRQRQLQTEQLLMR